MNNIAKLSFLKQWLPYTALASALLLVLAGCDATDKTAATKTEPQQKQQPTQTTDVWASAAAANRVNIYTDYTLSADLSSLSDNQKTMVSLLIDASKIMDDLFWLQAYGDKQELLSSIDDADARRFTEQNYGPWDRLNGDKPFLRGVGPKPPGAGFYPADISKTEFEAFDHPDKSNLYSVLRRDSTGNLIVVPYHQKYRQQLAAAADLLEQAAEYADNSEFKNYLQMRAKAITSDNYQPSDFAWMDMKTNSVDLVIGAIETYEDQLFGYRAAYEAYVLLKDRDWSERLARFTTLLPELQKGLPVDDKYKSEVPGTDSDLNAYDVIYYAGHSNSGAKTIAINLPNDEQVQLEKGTRRLQLKNAMQAKFDKVLVPIADQLIVADQRQHVTFNAFFSNTMFHEVAHGLGVKNTINDKGLVRTALKETASAMEEGKADILGLYMVTKLFEQGEITEGSLMDYYVTFMASIFRSSRFGASSAHGKANMIRFNYFKNMDAFARDQNGQYHIKMENFRKAMNGLTELLLTIQGDGDYDKAKQLLAEQGIIKNDLADDLARLADADIPVDIHFIQGKKVLGLE